MLPPDATPPTSHARRGGWMLLLVIIVVAGLAGGVVAGAVSAPLRDPARVAVTPQPGGPGAVNRPAGAGPGFTATPGAAGAIRGEEPGGVSAGPPAEGDRGSARPVAGPVAEAGWRANGVITTVDGDTMMVDTPDGPVRVTLGAGTRVERLAPAAPGDLTPGQRVVIGGEPADGGVTAGRVQIVGGQGPGVGDQGPGDAGRGGRGP